MSAGRRPKPTHLKIVQGNPGKRALPKREPRSPKGVPPMPDFLSDEGKRAWRSVARHLDDMGVLAHADQWALALLSEAYAEWDAARTLIEEEGLTYDSETQNGTIKRPHPAASIRDDAWRRMRSMLTEFGLTPAARAKVTAIPDAEEADPFEQMLNGRSG